MTRDGTAACRQKSPGTPGRDRDADDRQERVRRNDPGQVSRHARACDEHLDAGLLGSIDANRGDPQNGWDTDQFPTDLYDAVGGMLQVIEAGGLGRGGLNFDAKVRRESFEPEDLFHAHIGGADTLAQSLLVAERLIADGTLEQARSDRYAGWTGDLGAEILEGRTDLTDFIQEKRSAVGNLEQARLFRRRPGE